MAIIVVGHTKGGVGKSTYSIQVAAHLSRQGQNVMLVDTDQKQLSSATWIQRRLGSEDALPHIHCAPLFGNIGNAVKSLSRLHDHVVVDCGGSTTSQELASALAVADKLLTPFRSSAMDIDALTRMNGLVAQARVSNPDLQAFLVANETMMNLHEAAMAELMENVVEVAQNYMPEYKLVPVLVKTRPAYQTSYADGAGVVEYAQPSRPAVEELGIIFKELLA